MQFKAIILKLILLLSFCPYFNLQAQENYYSKTFTTESGLPHNHVHSIAQDSTGFLWIATWDGLSRYDGYEFKNYFHNPSDTNSIPYFSAIKVLVDFQNNVWVNCAMGISRYNRATDNFTQFLMGDAGGIALDHDGKFWVNTKSGLYRWNYESNSFEKVSLILDSKLKQIKNNYTSFIGFDNENRLWLITNDNDKYIYSRCNKNVNNELKTYHIGILEYTKYYNSSYSAIPDLELFVSKDSCFWQLGNFGNFKFNSEIKQFLPFTGFNAETDFAGLSKNDIQKAIEKHKLFKPIAQNEKLNSKPEALFVESVLNDQQNTVWQSVLSTSSQARGLTRNICTGKGFKHYFFELNPETGLNAVFPVLKDRFGSVWAGPTNVNQFFKIDKKGNTTQFVPVDQKTWTSARQPRSFLEDSLGIWIGYAYNLLLRYDFQTNRFSKEIFKTTDDSDRTLPLDFVHLKKEGDEIYIFGYRGIYKYHIKTREIKPLKLFDQNIVFTLYSVMRDKNTWWIGISKSRLIHYDNDFIEIGLYNFGTGFFNIEDIVQGDNNDLWLSQLGGGLVHFDKTTKKYKIYTTADGLSNNTCYGMLKDENGNLWISTNHGISRFNPKTGQFRIFGPEDGLKIDEFNSDNTYLAPDGEMFFGGMGGVVSFYPDSISDIVDDEKNWPLVLTDFKVSGINCYLSKAVYECDTVQLQKGDDNFQLSFACLDFRNAEKIKYRYRLLPQEEEYTQVDYRHRTLNYARLSPGMYRLEVESSNENGEWIPGDKLTIVIPALYYQTWWFRMLIVLVLVLLVAYFIFSYNRQMRLKARQQQDELRLESLRGQMNPHFIFNSLNSINYFISQNDRLSANRYIADFSRLIRSILGNLSHEYIPLNKELESLNDYLKLEHLRFSDKFDYEISVDETVITEDVFVFPGMVQPFIENAIWHGVRGLEGRKGMVKIRLLQNNPDCIIAVVEDDGIGRKLAESRKSSLPGKTSRGIGIVLERLKIINHLRQTNFQVTIEDLYPDREETGTRVAVEIPVKNAHHDDIKKVR
jgi:ligand-binding sensor domain-containing protein